MWLLIRKGAWASLPGSEQQSPFWERETHSAMNAAFLPSMGSGPQVRECPAGGRGETTVGHGTWALSPGGLEGSSLPSRDPRPDPTGVLMNNLLHVHFIEAVLL